jgi:hypothetical protein
VPLLSWKGSVHDVKVGFPISDSSGSISSSLPHETKNTGVAISKARMARDNNFYIEIKLIKLN